MSILPSLVLLALSTGQDSRPDPLRDATVLRGVVVDAAGRPVRDAEALLVGPDGPGPSALADADGRFALPFDSLAPGARLEVRSPSHAPAFLNDLPALRDSVHVGRIVLLDGVPLRGRVLDPEGRPLRGAGVYASPSLVGDGVPSAVSGDDGAFAIEHLTPGTIRVGAAAEGHADLVRREVRIGRGDPNEIEIRLPLEVPIAGTVRDESGAPVAGARVSVSRRDADAPFWRKPVETDANGGFRLAGLSKNEPGIEVAIAKAGYADATAPGASLPADGRWILRRGSLLTARLAREDGGPPPAIRSVRFEVFTKSGDGWRRVDGEAAVHEALAPHEWRITLPAAGRARVTVTTQDGATLDPVEADVSPATPAEVRVVLPRTGAVAGRVVRADRTGVAGTLVRAAGPRGETAAVSTDASGAFRFDALVPGVHSVEARSAEWVSDPLPTTVTPAGRVEGIEVVCRRASRLAGNVTIGGAPPGEEVAIAILRFERRRGTPAGPGEAEWVPVAYVATDSSGDYAAAPVPPGRLAVVPKRMRDPEDGSIRRFLREFPAAESAGGTVRVKAEEEARLDVDVPPGFPATVKGVVRVNGEGRPGLRVTLVAAGRPAADAFAGDGGAFRFRVERGGDYEVRASMPGVDASRAVRVADGDEAEVVLDFVVGAVRGVVTDPGGNPVSMRVRLERPRSAPAESHPAYAAEDVDPWESAIEAETGPDGRYAFPEAPVGVHRVLAYDAGSTRAYAASEPFEVRRGETGSVPPLLAPREAPLRVTVTSPEGRPPFASVRLKAAPGAPPLPRRFFQWLADGSVVVHGLPPGPLVAELHCYGPWEAPPVQVLLPDDGTETAVAFAVRKKD